MEQRRRGNRRQAAIPKDTDRLEGWTKENHMISSKDKSKVLPPKWTKPLQRQRPGAAWLSSSSARKALEVLVFHLAKQEPAVKKTNNIKGCMSRSTTSGSKYASPRNILHHTQNTPLGFHSSAMPKRHGQTGSRSEEGH